MMDNLLKRDKIGQNKSNISPFRNTDLVPRGINSNEYKMKIAESVAVIGKEGCILTNADTGNLMNVKKVIIKDGVTGIEQGTFDRCQNIEEIELPDSITELPDNAFKGHMGLKRVRLSGKMQVIAPGAFLGCENLERVELGDGTTEISQVAFAKCKSLKQIELPKSVRKIQEIAFGECSSLEKIVLPEEIDEIGRGSFGRCLNLSEVSLPKKIESIEEMTFRECKSLKKIVVPDNVKRIGKLAFAGCEGLIQIEFQGDIEKIERQAFQDCGKSVSEKDMFGALILNNGMSPVTVQQIESGVFCNCNSVLNRPIQCIKSINDFAFGNCKGVQEVSFGENITEIPKCAFINCKYLRKVTFPDSVTKISDGAFQNCQGLLSAKLPAKIDEVGAQAFYNCTGLMDIGEGDRKTINKIGIGAFRNCDRLIRSFKGIQMLGRCAFNSSGIKEVEFVDGIGEIPAGAFEGCKNLNKVTFSGSIKIIGQSAFNKCEGLSSVILPKDMKEVGDCAFQNCTNLKEIVFQGDIKKIGNGAFNNCGLSMKPKNKEGNPGLYYEDSDELQIDSPEIPEDALPINVQDIGEYAFRNCYSFLKQPKFKIMKTINNNAFNICQSIQEIELGDDITEIPDSAFKGCKDLHIVKLSKKLNKIGKEAFSSCINLRAVELPEKIEEIGDYAFLGCDKLTCLQEIGKLDAVTNVEKVGEGAFMGCNMLHASFEDIKKLGKGSFHGCLEIKGIDLKDGIEEIPARAFYYCRELTKIILPESVKKIGTLAFFSCTKLRSLKLGNNIEKIEKDAFYQCYDLKKVEPNFSIKDVLAGRTILGNVCRNAGFNSPDHNFEILDDQFIYRMNMDPFCPIIIEDKSDANLFSEGGPKIEDINQGKIGDCWLLATLGSIASCRPDIIQNIMSDNRKDGTVSVTLQREIKPGNFRKEVYTVKKSMFKVRTLEYDKEIMSEFKGNLWVQMMEKVFSAYFSTGLNGEIITINFNYIHGSGVYRDCKKPFQVILGAEAANMGMYKKLSGDTKEIFDKIQKNLNDNVPLALAVYRTFNDLDGDEVRNRHAYSLVGAQENNGKYCIQLRNPWGFNRDKNAKEKNAVITVDLKDAIVAGSGILNLHEEQE